MPSVTLHPHFTSGAPTDPLNSQVLRCFVSSGLRVGAPVYHLPVPGRYRPEYDAKLDNIPMLMEFVRSRRALIQRSESGSVIQVNYEPDKGGEGAGVHNRQYHEGRPNISYVACVAAMVSQVKVETAGLANVMSAVYDLFKALGESYMAVNDVLRPLFEHVDVCSTSLYIRGPGHNSIGGDVKRTSAEARRLQVRWWPQLWSVYRNFQAEPVGPNLARALAESLIESEVTDIIAYVEAENMQQGLAEVEGWSRILRYLV